MRVMTWRLATRRLATWRLAVAACVAAAPLALAARDVAAQAPRFEVVVAPSAHAGPLTGRLVIVLARAAEP